MRNAISVLTLLAAVLSAEPVRVHPDNPHYYLYQGRPTVLVTSAEHYGAVMNRAFDYRAYLDTLKAHGLNYTRIYPAAFVEPVGAYLPGNTLAPFSGDLIQPWPRSRKPGYRGGGNRFDLDRWDPAYFERLRDFLVQAETRGIVVQVCFFNAQNKDSWPMSPLNRSNNIQGEGPEDYNDVQTMKFPKLARRQEEFVRRIVREVNSFDNVILEICDEPASYGTPIEQAGPWLAHFVEVVRDADQPKKHLLGQQFQGPPGGPGDFSDNPDVTMIVTQYIWDTPDRQLGGMKAIDLLYDRNKPIDLNETGYYPMKDWYPGDIVGAVRVEAWEYMVGGGGSFNNLNGVYKVKDPGGKSAENEPVLKTIGALKRFLEGFDFLKMRPDRTTIVSGLPEGAFARGISEPGRQYAFYHHHSRRKDYVYEVTPGDYQEELVLKLPEGSYQVDWIEPALGGVIESRKVAGGEVKLRTPKHKIDVALRIR